MDLERVGSYLAVAFLIATFSSVLAWAATVSYVTWRRIEGVKPREVAEDAFFLSATLATIGVFVILTFGG